MVSVTGTVADRNIIYHRNLNGSHLLGSWARNIQNDVSHFGCSTLIDGLAGSCGEFDLLNIESKMMRIIDDPVVKLPVYCKWIVTNQRSRRNERLLTLPEKTGWMKWCSMTLGCLKFSSVYWSFLQCLLNYCSTYNTKYLRNGLNCR